MGVLGEIFFTNTIKHRIKSSRTSQQKINNFIPDVPDILVSKRVHVPTIPPVKTNYQGNQRLLLLGNAGVDMDKKIRVIKSEVPPEYGSRHPRTFMVMLGVIRLITFQDWVEHFKKGEEIPWQKKHWRNMCQ